MRLDDERLLDILEAIEAIERHLPATWEAFDGDELVRVWCLRHLEIIGEAAARLSDETRDKARLTFPGSRSSAHATSSSTPILTLSSSLRS